MGMTEALDLMDQTKEILNQLDNGETSRLSHAKLQDIADYMARTGTRFEKPEVAIPALHAGAALWAGPNVLDEHASTRKPLLAIHALHPHFQLQKAA